MKMPVVFVSHGAPDIALTTNATTQCWQQLGKHLPKPKAILVLSAHWTSQQPLISLAAQPDTIYDFAGFPNALYHLTYPALGAPDLAAQISHLLQNQAISNQVVSHGLDHGAWIPLLSLYPKADIPVLQLSIQPHLDVAWHIKLGQSLASLRKQGVLILGSGAVTHNFAWLKPHSHQAFAPAQQFADWLANALAQRDTKSLQQYRSLAPYGQASHPTDEHLLPVMAIYGASQTDDNLTRYTPEYTYAALAMDAYLWA